MAEYPCEVTPHCRQPDSGNLPSSAGRLDHAGEERTCGHVRVEILLAGPEQLREAFAGPVD
jgi:hypothetical protein